MNNKGFTLIELVMFIVVGGILLPASMIAFTSVMNNYSRPDYTIKARFYAEKRMSEITNRLYSDIVVGSCSNTDEGGGYTTECSIVTVNPDTLSTVTPNANYKRITVTVKHTGLLTDHIIVTMVAKRPKKTP
ncbi:MAG: prepilin-type N-terminal cleavage/methylation domain-containing protein [Syntrophorhabdaceae bacterium]|nr:prepilin-type N-terminal cleavage/methylation domain-containing protein [Syntrophorhabdaceae bacterium]